MRALFFILILQFFHLSTAAQDDPQASIAAKWEKEFDTAAEIINNYASAARTVADDPALKTANDCHMVLACGKYVTARSRVGDEQIATLLLRVPALDMDDPAVAAFMGRTDAAAFVDYYYMLRAMQRGEPLDAARDGLSPSTQFPSRPLNHNDYGKLESVFSGGNALLHDAYLKKLPFIFRNSGCTEEMAKLRPLIETSVADSPLRQQVLALYDRYEPLRAGRAASLPLLRDADGKAYTFADFAGKVVVVDIWATWCCSCLDKMPDFMRLRGEFSFNGEVVFMTVSIDRENARNKWLEALEQYGMTEMLNLITDKETDITFEEAYRIESVPRYLVIDKLGNVVDAFAPGPVEKLRNTILKTFGW